MYKYGSALDLNRLYSNSIHAMAEHYGIEAAYQAIIKVISTSFLKTQSAVLRVVLLQPTDAGVMHNFADITCSR
jgi:hypothetical protein